MGKDWETPLHQSSARAAAPQVWPCRRISTNWNCSAGAHLPALQLIFLLLLSWHHSHTAHSCSYFLQARASSCNAWFKLTSFCPSSLSRAKALGTSLLAWFREDTVPSNYITKPSTCHHSAPKCETGLERCGCKLTSISFIFPGEKTKESWRHLPHHHPY